MANDTTVATGSDRQRQEKTRRVFISASGEESGRANLDSIAGRIHFIGSNETLEFKFSDLSPEVARAAALFGVMTSVTNTVGRKDMSDTEMFDAAETRLKVLIEDGQWSGDRQTGPRVNDLLEAAGRWYQERGKEFTSDMQAEMKARLLDEEGGSAYRASMMARDSIKAYLEAIKAERAAERAAKAQAAAAQSNDTDDLL